MKKGVYLALLSLSAFAATKPGNAVKGKDAFDGTCAACHNAESTEPKVGPGLKGLFKKAAMANKKKATDATVLEIINKGTGGSMPPLADQLSDQEKADVIAYLKTL
ncbi:MAG TPA: cytochrome c [Bryobacteraceae bacterium]|jgi:mono/diheme cytochrome c family protein